MFAAALLLAAVPTAEMLTVFAHPDAPGPRITPYLRYQIDRGWAQDDRRRAAFESIRTEDDLLKLRSEIRARLLGVIGGLPDRGTPLNARITGTIAMDGYRIEKLVFESLPGLHVTALVYVPDRPAGRKPAVLVACGHSPDGKSFKNYQEISGQLARRGYVVLCWDPVGQGERSQFWDAARGRSRYNLVCGEHAVLGNLACIAGSSLNRYMAWDGMRAVDYLLTRPDVDGTRLSITGTSGGGFQSAYIGAVAPSCFITALPARMANRIFEDPDSDPEQDPYRLVSSGIDHAGLLLLVYPRPLVVAAAAKDFVPIEGTRKTFREVAALYRRFGHGDRIAMAEGYHTHMYSPENRRAAFAFLDRHNKLPAKDTLDAVSILDPVKLRCTPSGQVRVDLSGRSLQEVIRDEYRARPRTAVTIADLYRGGEETAAVENAGGSSSDGVRIDRYALHHGERLVIPVLHIHREDGVRRPMALDLSLDGKVDARRWSDVRAIVDGGRDVLSFDLRGTGETRMRYKAASIDDPDLAPLDEEQAYVSPLSGVLANYVYNSLLTGRPYFVEMIDDVAIVARFARERLGAERLSLVPIGEARALAEAAAEAIPGLELAPPSSGAAAFRWSEAVEQMREVWPIQYLLPGGAYLR